MELFDIPSVPGYRISKTGDVFRKAGYRCINERRIRPWFSQHYMQVHVSVGGKGSRKLVHRLVCEVFNGPAPSPKHQVNHIDGNKLNNDPDNLEWVTVRENAEHAIRTGLRKNRSGPRGDKNPRVVLNPEKARIIKERICEGDGLRKIARDMGISYGAVQGIKRGRTWTYI